MNKKKLALSTAALMLATGLTACGSVNKIVNEIDEKNYEAALEILASKELSEKNQEKLSEEMKVRIEEAVTAYANNECTYEDISALISTAYSMNLPTLTPTLAASSATMESLYTSKSYYEDGVEAFADENYSGAYNYFSYVVEEDAYFSDAASYMDKCVTGYCDAITADVDEYVADDDYEGALNYLGQCSYSAFSEEVTTAIEEMTETVRVKSVMAEAEEYVNSDDVASALTLITDSIEEYDIENTDELDKYYDTISADYIQMIMEKVDILRTEENYILALNMLSNAQEVVDAEEFATAVEEINAIKPTYLYDLKYSTSSRFEVVDSGDPLMDTIGNTYAVGNLFEISGDGGSWSSEEGSVEYNLGYNYGILTGVISVDDISDDATGTLKIEGDGVVLYSQALSRTTTPTPISIDVSNVNWLKISITEPSGGVIYAILSDFQFGDKTDVPTTEPPTEAMTAVGETTEATEQATEETAETTTSAS